MRSAGTQIDMTWVAVLVCLGSSCGGDGGGGTWTAMDSAGVHIVTSAVPAWSGPDRWQLADAPTVRIGEGDGGGAEEFTQIRRVFSLPGGNVLVVNQSRPPELRLFDAQGTWVRTFGGAGGGPGEFRFIWDAWLAPPDTIITFDAGLSRVTFFAPDGSVLAMDTFEQRGSAGLSVIPWDRFADGTFLMRNNRFVPEGTTGSGRSTAVVLRANAQGIVVDTIGMFPDVDFITMPSGAPNVLRYGGFSIQVVIGETYYRGMGDDFTIDAYDAEGTHVQSLRRSWTPRPVTDAMLDDLRSFELDTVQPGRREFLERDWADRPHADRFPAYGTNWLMDSDGDLWVPSFVTALETTTEWTVFGRDGRWLGTVDMPAALRPEEIGSDYVLGVWRDELDVQSVRRYPLVKP